MTTRNRIAYDVRTCDCCGVADRYCEPVSFGRSGLATLLAVLCPRCRGRAEDALLQAIKKSENGG
jgi:hypothetical protein